MLFILHANKFRINPSEDASSTLMILIATGKLGIDGIRTALLHLAGENPADETL
jgi:hypothetical protein